MAAYRCCRGAATRTRISGIATSLSRCIRPGGVLGRMARNFNADGFGSLYPKYRGGHPPKFTLPQRREIKKIAKSKPVEHDLPFSREPGAWPS